MVLRSCFSSVLFFLLLLQGQGFASYSFSPIMQEFSPLGNGSTHLFHVVNPNPDPVALQCYIAERKVNEEGVETLNEKAAEGLFLLYPPQIVLTEGQQQVIRVSWLGPSQIDTEQAYRLVCNQIPVDLRGVQEIPEEERSSELSQIKLLYNYSAALYVVPEDARSHVELESVREAFGEGEEKYLEVLFHNKGRKHQILKDLIVKFSSNDTGEEILALDKDAFEGGLNVLAGGKRLYRLKWPENLPPLPLKIDYDFTGKS